MVVAFAVVDHVVYPNCRRTCLTNEKRQISRGVAHNGLPVVYVILVYTCNPWSSAVRTCDHTTRFSKILRCIIDHYYKIIPV